MVQQRGPRSQTTYKYKMDFRKWSSALWSLLESHSHHLSFFVSSLTETEDEQGKRERRRQGRSGAVNQPWELRFWTLSYTSFFEKLVLHFDEIPFFRLNGLKFRPKSFRICFVLAERPSRYVSPISDEPKRN